MSLLWRVSLFFATAVIVAPRLGAVAAALHGAPAPLAGAAVVEEQPAAFRVGATAHPVEPRPGQEVARRPQNRRQQGERRAGPGVDMPTVAVAAAPQDGPRRGTCQRLVQGLEVARRGGLALGLGVEQPVEGFPQRQRGLELASRRGLRCFRPGREISRRVQRLRRRRLAAIVAGVGEIQSEVGAAHSLQMITG